jgi:hypothetical protein
VLSRIERFDRGLFYSLERKHQLLRPQIPLASFLPGGGHDLANLLTRRIRLAGCQRPQRGREGALDLG